MIGSFKSRLLQTQVQQAREYATLLSDYNPTDKAAFAGIIEGCTRHGLTQAELADEFKVSPATISRWCRSKSIPPEYVRGVIVERVAKLLKLKADELEQKVSQLKETPSVGEQSNIPVT